MQLVISKHRANGEGEKKKKKERGKQNPQNQNKKPSQEAQLVQPLCLKVNSEEIYKGALTKYDACRSFLPNLTLKYFHETPIKCKTGKMKTDTIKTHHVS